MTDASDDGRPVHYQMHADTAIPASRKVELTLKYYVQRYKVTSVVGTTYYKPGDWMTPDVVEQCCALPNWTVTMVDNDILASLYGMIGGLKP